MSLSGPIDVWTTKRKVYACGYRIGEVPLPVPVSRLVNNGEANVSTPPARRDRRRMFRRLNYGAVPGYAPLCLDTNDPLTVKYGFMQRLLGDVPKPDNVLIGELAEFVLGYCQKHFPRVLVPSFEEWLAQTPYTESRKYELREAYEGLRGGRPTARQCSHVDSFGKSESYPSYKHLRLINSRCDAFKVWSGPMFKAIESVVYELPEFIKHVAVPDRPRVIRNLQKAGAFYYQTDFTAFERHFVPDIYNAIECVLYKHCLGDTTDAQYLCNALTGENKMRTRTGVRANVRARRMSGDMCTSLGNGFTNLMLAKFIAHKKGGVLDGVVEGDDGLFTSTVPLCKEDYEKLGFTIKIDTIANPCHGSFCGMIFSESGQIIRNPRRFLQNFGWTLSFINAGTQIMDQLLRAKALSAAYETPNCPIVGVIARRALQKTRGVTPRFVDDGYHRPHDEFEVPIFNPSSDTRLLFEHMYGISINEQLLIEDAISRDELGLVAQLLPPLEEVADYASRFIEAT